MSEVPSAKADRQIDVPTSLIEEATEFAKERLLYYLETCFSLGFYWDGSFVAPEDAHNVLFTIDDLESCEVERQVWERNVWEALGCFGSTIEEMRASKEYRFDLSLYNKLDDWDDLSQDERSELRANYAIDVCAAVCQVRKFPEVEVLFAAKLAEREEDSHAEEDMSDEALFEATGDEAMFEASIPNWREEGF